MATLEENIRRRFLLSNSIGHLSFGVTFGTQHNNLNRGDMFSKMIKLKISANDSIPLIAFGLYDNNITESRFNECEIAMPIIISNYIRRRSLGSVFGNLSTYQNAEFTQLVIQENSPYYANSCFILNKDYKILVSKEIEVSIENSRTIKPWKMVLKINPCVFYDQNEPMNKAIIQKMIPAALSMDSTHIYYSSTFLHFTTSSETTVPIDVKIDRNLDDYIIKQVEPKDSPNVVNTSMQDIIIDDIDYISLL